MALAGGLSLAGGLVGLVQPVAARSVLDSLTAHRPAADSAAQLAGVMLAGVALNALGTYQLQLVAESVVRRSRSGLAARLLRLPVPEFDRQRSGDLISRVTSDTTLLRAATAQALVGSATSALLILGAVAAMLLLDPVLCAVTVGVLVLVALLSGFLMPRVLRAAKSAQTVVGELGALLDRAFGAFRTVKANGLEPELTAQTTNAAERAWAGGTRAAVWETVNEAISGLAVQLAFLAVLGLGASRVASGRLDVTALISFLLYLVYLSPLLTQLVAGISLLQRGLAAVERIAEVERLPIEPLAPRPTTPPSAAPSSFSSSSPARITFDQVEFRYPDRDQPVIAGLSLDLPAGGLTALVGPSGAGKSTLFALLERFYEPTAGRLTLDGRDLRHWPLTELRSAIGYVEQDTPVLAGTLRENLCLGAPAPVSDTELHRVLTLTRLDQLAATLPAGLDTQLGERGRALSGGQRQRVAIARALLRRPRLLLLDEPSSQLDAANEQALREAITEVSRHTTVLVIAHRLATATDADRIVVLEAGRIRSVGTHLDLLDQDDLYAALARTQLIAA
ncbi:ABC transporter ATP-binding protein [Kitasatospora sp. MMS16-BH015]|uniref:ABC transporter ATP-binding protein n=1 Tax=Kitasatospora sp. MMS16-BH015 TaxID=2018025 RepID=UPI0020C43DFB|nr:ABC transporter ATP-binding protein [Kitasatospora sp. MMS16-BH015]